MTIFQNDAAWEKVPTITPETTLKKQLTVYSHSPALPPHNPVKCFHAQYISHSPLTDSIKSVSTTLSVKCIPDGNSSLRYIKKSLFNWSEMLHICFVKYFHQNRKICLITFLGENENGVFPEHGTKFNSVVMQARLQKIG